ncbi:hypothetical protein Tco_0219114 [Tanacetum coccineum]
MSGGYESNPFEHPVNGQFVFRIQVTKGDGCGVRGVCAKVLKNLYFVPFYQTNHPRFGNLCYEFGNDLVGPAQGTPDNIKRLGEEGRPRNGGGGRKIRRDRKGNGYVEEEEMEIDAVEEWDGPEVDTTYQGAREVEAEAEVAPIPPPVLANPEPEAVTVGSSLSSAAVGHDPEDLTPSHIRSDLDALHHRVRQIKNDDVRAENKRLVRNDCWIAVRPYPERLEGFRYCRSYCATAPNYRSVISLPQEETSPSETHKGLHLVSRIDAIGCSDLNHFMKQCNYVFNYLLLGGQGGAPAVRECTFSGFMKCNPAVFHGHEGAVELSRWFKKTEMVFGISERTEARKVKFAAATLQGRTLTWWNSQVATRGLEAANQIGWTEKKRLLTKEFCPIEEIQRMEH